MTADTTLQIIGGLALILFLVSVSMSYKSWRAHTLVLVCFIFIATGWMFAYTAMTLKVHQVWRQILFGPPGEPEKGLVAQTLAVL